MSRGIIFPDVWKVSLVLVNNFVWNFAEREIIFEKNRNYLLVCLTFTDPATTLASERPSTVRLLCRRFVFKEKTNKITNCVEIAIAF